MKLKERKLKNNKFEVRIHKGEISTEERIGSRVKSDYTLITLLNEIPQSMLLV